MGTLFEDRHMLMSILCSVLPRMKSVSDKCHRTDPKTHFMFNIFSFENHVI